MTPVANMSKQLTKQERLVRTLAESKKDKTMTRKVDTYEYETNLNMYKN